VVLRPTKIGHFGHFSPSQSLGLVWKKLTLTQQKHAFTKKCIKTQNKLKKLKPGLVTFYDTRPGNEAGLFSLEKISKGGNKQRKTDFFMKRKTAYDINKQTIQI